MADFDIAHVLMAPLYPELENGLHAMAQPLTILRGALGALAMREQVAPSNVHYLEMSSKQVDRLCDLLSTLQGLMDVSQSRATVTDVDLWELVDCVLAAEENVAQELGVRIAVVRPQGPLSVSVDPSRTEDAVSAALKAVLSVSQRDDVIRIEILPRDGFVGLTLENNRSYGKSLSSSDRLGLALVEASVRSQDGLYELSENPVHVALSLRATVSQDAGADVASGCLEVAV